VGSDAGGPGLCGSDSRVVLVSGDKAGTGCDDQKIFVELLRALVEASTSLTLSSY